MAYRRKTYMLVHRVSLWLRHGMLKSDEVDRRLEEFRFRQERQVQFARQLTCLSVIYVLPILGPDDQEAG